MAEQVNAFIRDCYQLISASSPTVPLHGNDQSKGIQYLNELLAYYSANGLLITVPRTYAIPIAAAENVITFADGGTYERLSNPIQMWLSLSGTDYPLKIIRKQELDAQYKYGPLSGLPLYAIFTQNVDSTEVTLYPSPSQSYTFNVYGKFAVGELTSNDTMSDFAPNFIRFLRFAVARDLALYKGRSEAWTDMLEQRYNEGKMEMESGSTINLSLTKDYDTMLNGAARVRAGV